MDFDWTRRAQAWDRHQALLQAEARQQKDRQKAELLAARREEAQEQDYHLSNQLRQAIQQLLDRPQIEKTVDRQGTHYKHAKSLALVESLMRALITLENHAMPPAAAGLHSPEPTEQFIIDPLLPESGVIQ